MKTTQLLSEVFESPKALGSQIVSNQLWKIATLPVPRLALTNSGRTIVAMVVHYFSVGLGAPALSELLLTLTIACRTKHS